MFRVHRIFLTSLLACAIFLAPAFAYAATIDAEIITQKIDSSRAHTAEIPIVETQTPFIGLALHVSGDIPHDASVKARVQIRRANLWSEWLPLAFMEHEGKDATQSGAGYTYPLFVSGDAFRYTIDGLGMDVTQIEIIALNADESTLRNFWQQLWEKFTPNRADAQETVNIVSRADWGADESLRFWKSQYTTPTHIVVHHTAGSDGSTDPETVIQAIYFYHAKVLKWGDIGYNYLIDAHGTIYEGRFGGDGVIGAHAYNEEKEINYNDESIGIAVLGCFEAFKENGGSGGCATPNTMTYEAVESLVNLAAEKVALWNLDPTRDSAFIDTTLPVIVGHKDVDATLCPGNMLHDHLVAIRQSVVERVAQFADVSLPFQADVVSHTLKPATFLGDAYDAIVTVKNTGTETWNRDTVKLYTYDLGFTKSPYYSSQWPATYGGFLFQEQSVAPDSTATFTVKFTTPALPGLYKHLFEIKNSTAVIPGSSFSVTTRADAMYRAEKMNNTAPLAMLHMWRVPVTVRFKNTGVATWGKNVVLKVYDLGYRTSPFRDKTWKVATADIAFSEKTVAPGSTATYSLRLDPSTLGLYRVIFKLGIAGHSDMIIDGGESHVITRVD